MHAASILVRCSCSVLLGQGPRGVALGGVTCALKDQIDGWPIEHEPSSLRPAFERHPKCNKGESKRTCHVNKRVRPHELNRQRGSAVTRRGSGGCACDANDAHAHAQWPRAVQLGDLFGHTVTQQTPRWLRVVCPGVPACPSAAASGARRCRSLCSSTTRVRGARHVCVKGAHRHTRAHTCAQAAWPR